MLSWIFFYQLNKNLILYYKLKLKKKNNEKTLEYIYIIENTVRLPYFYICLK